MAFDYPCPSATDPRYPVRQNAVVRKISEVTTTISCWSISSVTDLNPYVTVTSTMEGNLNHLLDVIQTMVENHAHGSNGLGNHFLGLSNEIKTLHETYFGVNTRLAERPAVHARNKRSVRWFLLSGKRFLFGTVSESEGDLGTI